MTLNDESGGTLAILGPGGVGGLLAGLLARHGERVVCVAAESTVRRLNDQGLTVRSGLYGTFTVPMRAVTRLSEPVEACFVAVKTTSLDQAIERVPRAVLGQALVVPLLNGIEHMALLRSRYHADQVVAATIRVESTRVGPGEIEHASPFTSIELDAVDGDPRVEKLAQILRRADLDVKVRDDELDMLWDKFSFLVPLALLTTVAAAPVGRVRSERRDELVAVVREVAAVARAIGVSVDAEVVMGMLDRVPETMQSSLQRDVAAGRPTEIEAIGGAILRTAGAAGVQVPVTKRIVEELQSRLGGVPLRRE